MSKTWNDKYMGLAKHVAQWSKDPSTQVGAVLVGRPGEVSLGYNGFPRGITDLPERLCNKQLKYKFTQHAERNVLDNTHFDTSGSTLYVTMYPCSECAKSIVNRGVKRVFCPPPVKHPPWSEDAQYTQIMFDEAGVSVIFLE